MAIQVDAALGRLPDRLRREIDGDIARGRRSPISETALQLNAELMERRTTIDSLRRQLEAERREIEKLRVLTGVALKTLRQIGDTPRNRKARVNAKAAMQFIETQAAAVGIELSADIGMPRPAATMTKGA